MKLPWRPLTNKVGRRVGFPEWHDFMNTTEELHSFVIGFFEVLCPWPAHCHCERSEAISKEYHYYVFGRGMAIIAWIIIAKIIQEVFF